jgi:hypothetical protein
MGYSGAQGKLIMKTTMKSKISCHTHFKHDIVCDLPKGLERAQSLPRRFAANRAGLTRKKVKGEKSAHQNFGQRSSVPDPRHFGVDPDSRIHHLTNGSRSGFGSGYCYFHLDLQDANKKLI